MTQTQSKIPLTLIGQNATYQVLKEPENPAYPHGNEVRYSDEYISRLNNDYPLNKILGENIKEIANKRGLERFVMGSPLRNCEAEDILAYILINSAQAETWQPFIISPPHLTDTFLKTAKEYIENIAYATDFGKIEAGILFGLKVAKKAEFAFPIEHDNKVIVVPSQKFVNYITAQG